ncbi:MAG: STAS domain-containing protein [Thermoanaerobaculia bacterium]
MSSLEVEFSPDAMEATGKLFLRGRAGFKEAHYLRKALFDAIAVSGDKNLVVELGEMEWMDTTCMAVLVEGLMATREGTTAIFLMCPSESVRKIFQLAGLEEALTRCYSCWDDLQISVAS